MKHLVSTNGPKPEFLSFYVICPTVFVTSLGETMTTGRTMENNLVRQQEKSRKAAANMDHSAKLAREQYDLEITLPWDEDALTAIAKAPGFVRKVAVGNVEDYAGEQGLERVSLDTVRQQAESVGMGKFLQSVGTGKGGLLKRIFSRNRQV